MSEYEKDLKCCGNCLWCMDCGMKYPWRICQDWKFDNNTRGRRINEKEEMERMAQQVKKLNEVLEKEDK